MPQDWTSVLDTPSTFEVVGAFEGGMVSYADPRLLAPNQSSLLQNCEISITGKASTRFGTAYLGSSVSAAKVEALFYMNTTTNQQELMWVNNTGTIYKLSGGVWTSTAQSITISDIPSIVQGANLVYFAGGNTSGASMYKWDGTTFTQLDGDGATQAPRAASILLWHMNRLVAAGPSIKSLSTDPNVIPDAIYFSNILDATNWGSPKGTQQIRVGAGDGQAITALVPWTQFTLAVFKRRSVWVVNADPSVSVANMQIQLVHGSVGCMARKTAVQVGADIFFLADDGIRSLSHVVGSDTQHDLSIPLSYPVQDYINRINTAGASNACAIYWRNLYIIALPLDSSTTNNFVLVYNTLTQSWAGVWTNLPVNCMAVRLVSGVPRLMAGFAATDRVIEYNDYVLPSNWVNATFQDYDASAVQPRIIPKPYLLNDPLAIKVAKGGEIEWNNSDGTIKIFPILDEVTGAAVNNNTAFNVSSGGFVPPITPPFLISPNGLSRARFDLMQYGEYRTLQLDIQGLTGGRKEFRQISVAGFVRPALVGNS